MAGSSSEESGVSRSFDGLSNGQQQQRSGEALAEWRSSEQVENGITSTSPPYWDTDDDRDFEKRPSDLYGKYTWKIDKFSQINKRELRSNAFEVGGYKWYILIYPQGCDVCNFLSLFLCVAEHDKLLPGWSHFAQFTIAVVNKDPKKSKYSDTLHRFWKKEHDWGWKKFMELSKVMDGFVDADTLIIKAQVQVIRERADRPFRCLDRQYRRELVRVYLSNVEQICRRFVEEKRGRLGKLIEDKARWSGFCNFWSRIDKNLRQQMSREKSDSILKVVVKQFFIEKEVTSTLVMDSLYSGLKALEDQSKNKGKCDAEEVPIMPVVHMENDMFLLVDDVLLLLERAAIEPLPPKDEKGPQNRTKDGGSGEDFSKDTIERDERRLTELGRRTIEIFVLAHIFSKIEVAYQEAVALKRQEELIREEEEAWIAESEKRASEKEKKSKKKQAKQKRNNRKLKDKARDEKPSVVIDEKPKKQIPIEDDADLSKKPGLLEPLEPLIPLEDVSDVSDSVDCVTESPHQPDSDDRDSSPVHWDTDTSEPHHPPTEACSSGVTSEQNGGRKSPSAMDDSSSTCSSDSVPSVVTGGPPYRGSLHQNQKSQSSPSRGKVKHGKGTGQPHAEGDGGAVSLQDKKVEEVVSLQKKLTIKDDTEPERHSKEKITVSVAPSSPKSPSKASPRALQKSDLRKTAQNTDKPVVSSNLTDGSVVSKPYALKPPERPSAVQPLNPAQKHVNGQGALTAEKPVVQVQVQVQQVLTKPLSVSSAKPVPPMSRPLSAPLVDGSRTNANTSSTATTPVISMVQTAPFLSRSASAAGYLGPDPSSMGQSYGPPSYRNAMMGSQVSATSSAFSQTHSYSQPMFLPQTPERIDTNSIRPSFSFGMMNHDVVLQNGSQWMESVQRDNGISRSQPQGMLADEFPHLDIINDLLDDEYAMPIASTPGPSFLNGPRHLSHQFTFPGDVGGSLDQGPSTSSCRFDRTRSFPEEFQHSYGGGFDFSRDLISPQPNLQPYVNGQIDGLVQNQWQIGGSDLSYGLRTMDGDGYPYHMPAEFSSLTMGVNGYTMYRPNGQ
ncbi:putative MATH/TRAF domain-containing protein [Helianthus annuus]|nr:putative MATH/TRAF domain-containing protein [Helianthus annuus]KAJ0665663.1 putative MATH/TRAF domain-containing protein [Helianthus annuus]